MHPMSKQTLRMAISSWGRMDETPAIKHSRSGFAPQISSACALRNRVPTTRAFGICERHHSPATAAWRGAVLHYPRRFATANNGDNHQCDDRTENHAKEQRCCHKNNQTRQPSTPPSYTRSLISMSIH